MSVKDWIMKHSKFLLIGLLEILTVSVITGRGFMLQMTNMDIKATVVIGTLLLVGLCMLLYTQTDKGLLDFQINTRWVQFGILYGVCLLLVLIAPSFPAEYIPLGMTGLLFALFFGSTMGLAANVLFSCLNIIFISEQGDFSANVKLLLLYLLYGCFMAILIPHFKELQNYLYFCVIAICLHVGLLVTFESKFYGSIHYGRIGLSCLSLLAELVIVGLILYIILYRSGKTKKHQRLEAICKDDFYAIQLYKKRELASYYHARDVERISKKAGEVLGLNVPLICAGALYHEIGKLEPGDYVLGGITIAKRYHLPMEVGNIIVEHNCKHQLPQSVESAVVMLVDSALSTIEYYEKTKGKHNIDRKKTVEKVLKLRLEEGCLDESGMSVQQYHKLCNIFSQLFPLTKQDVQFEKGSVASKIANEIKAQQKAASSAQMSQGKAKQTSPVSQNQKKERKPPVNSGIQEEINKRIQNANAQRKNTNKMGE